jgi:putative NADPH-quinone reductase
MEGLGTSYGSNFPPALTVEERASYYNIADPSNPSIELAPEVAEAVADLQWAQALVVVYPTWWMNVPGTLKVSRHHAQKLIQLSHFLMLGTSCAT